jgi:hypothetical protein
MESNNFNVIALIPINTTGVLMNPGDLNNKLRES